MENLNKLALVQGLTTGAVMSFAVSSLVNRVIPPYILTPLLLTTAVGYLVCSLYDDDKYYDNMKDGYIFTASTCFLGKTSAAVFNPDS
ncbi:MAG: hypothetical protein ACK4OM_03675 [Alphaproteobacteria bacterium]